MTRNVSVPGRLAVAAALILMMRGTPNAEQQVPLAIVVNEANTENSVSRVDIEAIYRGTLKRWHSGDAIIPVNFAALNPHREQFDRALLGLSPHEVSKMWIDQRIRGVARPPKHVEDASVMVKVIVGLRGAIGYLPVSLVGRGMRVVGYVRNGRIEIEPGRS